MGLLAHALLPRTETLMLGQDQETGETGDEGLWSIDTESANASGVGAYDAKKQYS